jgi:hypothetical protein
MVNVVSGSTKAAVLLENANHMKAKKLLFAGDQHGSPGLKPGRTKAGHRVPARITRVCTQLKVISGLFRSDFERI